MMSSEPHIDHDLLRSWIGRQLTSYDIVSVDLARRFHATFEMAGDEPQVGDAAPRLIHFCLAQPAVATAKLGEDGHPMRGGFLPPAPLPRRMWAGGYLTFHGDLRIGETVQRTSRVADVAVKEGRTGILCFVTVERIVCADNRVLVEERQDIIYRSLDAGKPRNEAPTAEAGRHQRRIQPSPPLLFRYSALTFNSHRIHYDRRYAVQAEGYPGLVIHGPLQTTLLMNFATEIGGKPPARFAFRSVSPLFDNEPFVLNATQEGDGLKLWTARTNGPIAMSAEAEWS